MEESFLGLLGDNSSLLDLDLLDVLAESSLDGLDDVGLVGLEGVEVAAPSDFELGDFRVLFDEDGYVMGMHTLFDCLLGLVCGLAFLEEV
jgi:hypothetical protein